MAGLARASFSFEIRREVHHEAIVIDVAVAHAALERFCLELTLLFFQEIESIAIVEPHNGFRITIHLNNGLAPDSRGRAQLEENKLTLDITHNEVGAWAAFFLRYYRDGAADAPRVELELTPDRTNIDRGLAVEFLAERAKPPKTGPIEEWLFPEEFAKE